MYCRLYESKVGPLEEHIRRVQNSKPLENFHWLLDYSFIGFSMILLPALNSPR